MHNSTILPWIELLLSFLGRVHKESAFNKWFLRLDIFLKKAAINSRLVGLFIIRSGMNFFEGSIGYRLILSILKIAAKKGKIFGIWTRDSKIIRMVENIINQTFRSTYRIIGIFMESFLIANISLGLIFNMESRDILIFKLILLIMFLIVTEITVNFEKTLKDSKFYKFFQWIIEVEK